MDVVEIAGYQTGISREGVNFLQPADAFQNIVNGFIYRQVLQSRKGVGYFAPRLADESRITGIFEHILPDGTKELLATDLNFLYKFNTGTGVFDQISFGGSMAAYGGFAIGANDFYVSGTSYPDKDNNPRFVFVCEGFTPNAAGSAIFFYDGTNVLDYTAVADNPDYEQPAEGPLNSATYVLWFNERINFIVPIIDGIAENQGVLFSGIRDSSGNGDKFNVPGSGLFRADTYQNITGASILGQILLLNFNRSAYVLERTRDAFNPYFGRAVPGVLGTNAKFSAVSWADQVHSVGKTGVLACDGRQNLRTDDKIPNFTADEIDQDDFNLTYGGFDRINNQFLWAYKINESDLDTQNGVLVKNYHEKTWATYQVRFSVFGQTDKGLNIPWNQIDETTGNESWARWDTTEELWNRIGVSAETQKTLAGDDLGFIYELNSDYDDYFSSISNITAGTTTTITCTAVGILAGDLVTISNVEGMTEINNFDTETSELTGDAYVVLSATPTSIEINVDSSEFTAYTTGGDISKTISFSAETIPFNPYRKEGNRCFVSHLEFLIDANGGSLLVDVYADQEPTPFKRDILVKPASTTQPNEWVPMTVDQEANFLTFVLKQQSPAVQLRLTSMRIHCMRGGMTSG